MSLEPRPHLGLHKPFSCKHVKKEHASTNARIQRQPRKIFSQRPLCTDLFMISCKHPLEKITTFRTSHQDCHCHGTKALLLEIHVLRFKTSIGAPPTLSLTSISNKEQQRRCFYRSMSFQPRFHLTTLLLQTCGKRTCIELFRCRRIRTRSPRKDLCAPILSWCFADILLTSSLKSVFVKKNPGRCF